MKSSTGYHPFVVYCATRNKRGTTRAVLHFTDEAEAKLFAGQCQDAAEPGLVYWVERR